MSLLYLLFAVLVSYISQVIAGTMRTPIDLNSTATWSTCGLNCPSGCSSCPCGTSTAYQNIDSWCAKYSWNQTHCKCIASAESAGNGNYATENSDGTFDVGLWQINEFYWDTCNGGAAPCYTASNLNCAIDVYKLGGNTWKLWSSCSKCGCCGSA